jgi:hypothetical protein
MLGIERGDVSMVENQVGLFGSGHIHCGDWLGVQKSGLLKMDMIQNELFPLQPGA